MESHITVADAAARFTDLVERVRGGHETFVVEEGGRPVCRIEPAAEERVMTVADLVAFFRTMPQLDDDYLDIVERHIREQPNAPTTQWES